MPDRDYRHRALIDKLGVRPGARVAMSHVDDAHLDAQLRDYDVAHVDRDADVVLLGVAERGELDAVAGAWQRAASGGALWVVYPRGIKAVTENDVRQAGLALGIVDNKVARFSDTHTAMRFVARRTRR